MRASDQGGGERATEAEIKRYREFLADEGVPGSVIGRIESRHRALGGGNALRAAVLGANDGLVSNLALVAGFAGPTRGRAPSCSPESPA